MTPALVATTIFAIFVGGAAGVFVAHSMRKSGWSKIGAAGFGLMAALILILSAVYPVASGS